MAPREQAQHLWSSMLGLGTRRLAALAVIGVTVFAVVALGAVYLSRSEQAVLYSGLERSEIGRIGAALGDAGIAFDATAAGDAVLVASDQATRARMLLAQQGLPKGASVGYELFDDLGSLGLTSFMQQVTRVRALEGELARTIQMMEGIDAARVHLVLPDEGSFRRESRPPSASVVLRADLSNSRGSAGAIQHLVAGAVPGMAPSEVTVLTTDGVMIAGGEGALTVPSNMVGLEQTISHEIRDNIRRTLTPYLGLDNFQVSVAARLNADRQQVSETVFDPASRVERSTRTVRENELTRNSSGTPPTSVEQNLPEDEVQPGDGETSNSQTERREELANYEISSKTITTIGDGYGIDRLSVAVLIDHGRLAASLGGDPGAEAIDARLAEIRQLISSAAGLNEARGDTLALSAVDFLTGPDDLAPVPPPSLLEIAARQSGTLINAGTILLVSLLVIWFGLRPATKALIGRAEVTKAGEPNEEEGVAQALASRARPDLIGDLASRLERSPQKRLEQIVDFDEQRAAALLREWVHQGKPA